MLIGERTEEQIKIEIGSALLDDKTKDKSKQVKGRDLVTGVPKTITLSSAEVNEALLETIVSIIDVVRVALENTPPELSADLIERGMILAGGGSLLRGINKLLSEETGLPVHISEDPITSVALGTGKVLEELHYLKRLLVPPKVEMRDVDCVNLFSKIMVVDITFAQGKPGVASTVQEHLFSTPCSNQHV